MATSKKHSPRFETVKRYFDRGTWSKAFVSRAVGLGHITADEYKEICGEDYPSE